MIMQEFELVLKNEKIKFYNRLATFIFMLNGVLISYFFFSDYSQITNNAVDIAVLILLLIAIVIYIIIPPGKKKELSFLFTAISIALYWVLIGYWWIGAIMLLLFFLFKTSKRILKVQFFTDKIIYTSLPDRIIQWDQLTNVILKDQLLTIDFKNNKIIQQLLDVNNMPVNEKEFNEFCKQQLTSYS